MSVLSPLALALALALLHHGSTNQTDRGDKRFFMNRFTRRPLFDDPKTCSCTCGERNDASRIVGGKPALTNEFPWMVRLSYLNRFYCGGMLINDRYVLTAAHCVKGFMWFMIKVTFGEHDRCDTSHKPETRFVLRAVTGDFSYRNFDHDIALLRLNDRVPLAETIRPICLPSDSSDLFEGSKAIATGWGTLKEDGKAVCILQEVELPVMSNKNCRQTNYNANMITDNMLCAGYLEGKKDSCQGDSGGPLIRERPDKRYELIGVTSWGNGCARPGYPGIYTRVTRYLDWIRNNTAGGCWCEDGGFGGEPTTESRGQQTTEMTAKVEETTKDTSETTTESILDVMLEVANVTLEVTTEETSEVTTNGMSTVETQTKSLE